MTETAQRFFAGLGAGVLIGGYIFGFLAMWRGHVEGWRAGVAAGLRAAAASGQKGEAPPPGRILPPRGGSGIVRLNLEELRR